METSPAFLKYSKMYEKDNTSVVFAKLADLFRQAKLYDKAEEILKNGLKYHPNYVAARIVYAKCLMDMGSYDKAYKVLRPYLEKSLDNLKFQQIFVDICLQLNNEKEALTALKYIAFLQPANTQVKDKIKALENYMALEVIENVPFTKESENQEQLFDLEKIAISDATDWNAINLYDTNSVVVQDLEIEKISQTVTDKEIPVPKKVIVTPTLVDLYITQGLLTEAKNLLIEELSRAENKDFKAKLEDVEKLIVASEVSGHQKLMNIFDAKVKKEQNPRYNQIKEKYMLFLEKVRIRALQV